MSKPQALFISPPNFHYSITSRTVELPQRQFGIRDQGHIWAFDGNSLISFFTVSENQREDNLPVLRQWWSK